MAKQIIHLARLFSPHVGGVETHVREIAKIQVKRGFAVTVITEQHQADLPLQETIGGIKIIRIPQQFVGKKLPIWRWMWRYRNLLAGAARIQVHDVFWWLLPVFFLLSGEIITTFHGWETNFPVRITAKLQRWIYAQKSGRTVHVGTWIRDFYWDKPDAVTYGGVRKEFLRVGELRRQKNQKLQLVFFGRLAEDNGVNEYCRVLSILRKKGIKFAITWIGEGPLMETCREYGRILGSVRNPIPFLIKADIVFSSSYLSMMEAQALGKVVAAVYQNSLKEAYLRSYPGAFAIFLAGNSESLAEKIIDVTDNHQKMMALAEKSRHFARSQTWEKVADMYEKISSN